jgi:hypothetical protein
VIVGIALVVAAAIAGAVVYFGGSDDAPAATSSVATESSAQVTEPAETTVEATTTVTDAPTTSAPATTAVASTEATTTTEASPATTPGGLPVVFPDAVPAEACTPGRVEDDTDLMLAYEPWCVGAWALSVVEGTEGDEGADVFRWDGTTWWYRGYFYAMCDIGLTGAGMPPAVAREMLGGMTETCISPPELRPEPSGGPLQWGDQGPRVEALQQALIDRNLLFDEADGQFGPNTEAAVRDLEYFLGLDADGVADSAVFAELGL